MDIDNIIKTIKNKASDNNHPQIAEDIDLLIRSGSTGGEILAMVGKYLYDLRFKNPQVYELVKNEVTEFLKYCTENGMIIS